jgi:hypothetical protein
MEREVAATSSRWYRGLDILANNLFFIDNEVAASFQLQIAPVALIADQTLVPATQLLS